MAAELRADKSGLAREVQQKLTEKFDEVEAAKLLRWICLLKPPSNCPSQFIEAMQKIPPNIEQVSMDEFSKLLRDGLVLGFIMACLDPSSVAQMQKVQTWQVSDKPVFETNRRRDRIGLFLRFSASFGVDSVFQFQTDQLYENTNLTQVVVCLTHVGMEAQAKPECNVPQGYWIQKHKENRRQFSEEQLRSGERIIGLQMGSTAGANASGITFGGRRHITDTF
ncbi:Transgelin [Fasciolopsis buskii]|uniref:Transgelin n=1 Tax=Fasciolopsis buskii TaxID=27845 RepID=A0A8E0S451_9TREM|nr:Transgelin [Fasciolopsis buski]